MWNTLTDSKKRLCNFEKPRKRACLKNEIELIEQSEEGSQSKYICKKSGCQTESKALEKAIVARFAQKPCFGLFNPSEMY